MYKDKHVLTRLSWDYLRDNDFRYPHGERAPEWLVRQIQREAS
jgi:hypothetical protein